MAHIMKTLLILFGCLSSINGQTVTIEWDHVIAKSKTTPTLQVVVNPLIRRTSKIHNQVFRGLEGLKASHVRYVPWLPYPRLAVAELEPPTKDTTSWNFTLIDPMTEDFMSAQNGRKVVINFSTIPAWMFQTTQRVSYPDNPDENCWNYTQGTELVDPSMKQLADYYERLVSWYVKGEFDDENGKRHTSGHNYTFDYWEVLNEVDQEHNMSPKQYTDRYDAIVSAVKKVSPNTKFVGLALAVPANHMDTFAFFLNHSNHRPDVPLDAISYHFYANSPVSSPIESMQTEMFNQANGFLTTVRAIEAIRKPLSPNTQTMINELGSIVGGHDDFPPVKAYWHLSGAIYAYLYSELAFIGIEFVGESQLVGYPHQYPSVSMVDWNTGAVNARAMVLKLLIDNCGPGDKLVNTTISSTDAIHGMAFVTTNGHKKLLLINKRIEKIRVNLPEGAKQSTYIDVKTENTLKTVIIQEDTIDLDGFAVHVIDY